MMVDRAWAEAVERACDPVFTAAEAGFVFQLVMGEGGIAALLWEADPLLFAARFPGSGIEESYGEQWPAPCIDFWVYLEGEQARISYEGWSGQDVLVPLTGDGGADGAQIAGEFSRILHRA